MGTIPWRAPAEISEFSPIRFFPRATDTRKLLRQLGRNHKEGDKAILDTRREALRF